MHTPERSSPSDLWIWRAIYEDGSYVAEQDEDGDHAFGDIDLNRIRAFELLPAAEGQPAFSVLIDPTKGQRPIFFRRRASAWLIAGGPAETLLTCIGRQQTVNGTNVSVYVFFDTEGHIVIADNREAV